MSEQKNSGNIITANLKKQMAYQFLGQIESVTTLPGLRFAYAVSKTKQKLTSLVNELEGARTIKDKSIMNSFQEKRIALCHEYCVKDEQGQPKFIQGQDGKPAFDIPKEIVEGVFKDKMKELEASEPFKTAFENAGLSYEKQCNEEIDFADVIHFVKMDDLPEGINADQIDAITWMIRDFS